MKRSLVVAAVLAALLAPGAEAHFGTGKLGYRSTITAVKPHMPGLKFKVLYGDDQIFLDNRSGRTVIIKGYSGEPYLRFAPSGMREERAEEGGLRTESDGRRRLLGKG